jgi:L-histidine Nalpha-methyltransferase
MNALLIGHGPKLFLTPPTTYLSPMPALRFYDLYAANPVSIQAELSNGLLAAQAHTSPKYLYDKLGSRLFDAITELPEYYPTRTEAAIFTAQREVLASTLPSGACLVDLGAGSCAKAAGLFGAVKPSQYIAIDISANYLRDVLAGLSEQHPTIAMAGVGMDFSATLDLPADVLQQASQRPIVSFYPGSSIGNFAPDDALAFLQRVQRMCAQGQAGGGLLIGVDLVKATDVLEPAYDDPLGVTGAFNLNMLRHINTLLGSDFDVRDWQHVAFFNTALSRIEMHLEARRALTVRWTVNAKPCQRAFAAGERIHTENSYKWTVEKFSSLLKTAGFSSTQAWTDELGYFAVLWAGV